MPDKVSPGARVGTNPLVKNAGTVNDVLDLVNRSKVQGFDKPAPAKHSKLGANFVMVKNVSGAVRARGDCMQLGDYLLSDENIYKPWFEADLPHSPLHRCVILAEPAGEDKIVPAHASGVCVGSVDVQDTDDTHARIVDSSYALQSSTSGEFELLMQATGEGEQLMAMRFASVSQSIALVKITSHSATDRGCFAGKLQITGPDDLPGTFTNGADIWIVFANCDHATLNVVEDIRLFGVAVGEKNGADSADPDDERPLYMVDYPLPDFCWATLTEDLLSEDDADATRINDTATINVVDRGMIAPGKKLASGVKVWAKQECGVWYLVNSNLCPVTA